jgi:hypothetical protein
LDLPVLVAQLQIHEQLVVILEQQVLEQQVQALVQLALVQQVQEQQLVVALLELVELPLAQKNYLQPENLAYSF